MRDHYRGARESVLVQIAGVFGFAAVIWLVSNFVQPSLSGWLLIIAGLAVALVPAALWLVAFYRQDRLEPEPRRYVLGIFLLSALLAQAVGQPLLRNVFQVQNVLGSDLLTELTTAVLVVGLLQEFIKYAVVRYTVFGSAEFDQRVDGIIYGASAGLGYATLLNIDYIVGNGGVDLGVGALRVAIAALAHASFGGVSGYFLGRAKFDQMGRFWLPFGLVIAAVLNGIVSVLLREVTTLGNLGFNPWYGLIVAVLVAGGVFALLLRIIQRLNAVSTATVS